MGTTTTVVMKKKLTQYLQLAIIVGGKNSYCYWCGQNLKPCDQCNGQGIRKETSCKSCGGNGKLCPTHDSYWD